MKQIPKILTDDEAEEEFGHLILRDPEAMRRADAEAVKRLREYIEEHRGNLLALNVFASLFHYTRYGRD